MKELQICASAHFVHHLWHKIDEHREWKYFPAPASDQNLLSESFPPLTVLSLGSVREAGCRPTNARTHFVDDRQLRTDATARAKYFSAPDYDKRVMTESSPPRRSCHLGSDCQAECWKNNSRWCARQEATFAHSTMPRNQSVRNIFNWILCTASGATHSVIAATPTKSSQPPINNFQYQREGAAIPKLLVSGVQH